MKVRNMTQEVLGALSLAWGIIYQNLLNKTYWTAFLKVDDCFGDDISRKAGHLLESRGGGGLIMDTLKPLEHQGKIDVSLLDGRWWKTHLRVTLIDTLRIWLILWLIWP